ncbi:hypothetical protein [Shewanella frigidimarina]|uniref:Lipoprotein n=1 Tax=Shewanella frigidimarina TaxID=56812 RepID=A0A106BZK5_SHEFR|nr:hypothetical protein [Shewanella frigidimarina]KVX01501.1 hypothetical protein AWJ07_17330 [Shewanella frigidimarina]
MHHKSLLAILISGALLAGCGSSDDDSTTDVTQPDAGTPTTPTTPPVASEYTHQITGLAVYQGALSGATVCADLNKNLACDSDEPFAITDADGNYQIDWKSEVETPDYYLVANWQAATATQAIQARSLALKVKNPTNRAAPKSIVDDAGQGTLIASPQYNGAINNLTHIKQSRVIEMMNQDLSDSEINQLSTELDALLAILYQLDANTLYSVSAEMSAKASFTRIDYAIAYLQQVIATQIPNLIAAEKILAATYAQIWQILSDSGLSIEEFFSDDTFTLAANILFSDSAIALGFTELPIDSRILSQNDWDVVLGNIINERGFANTLSLILSSDLSGFSMRNTDNTKVLTWISMLDGQALAFEAPLFDDDDGELTECWHSTDKRWYTENNGPVTEPRITGNTYNTVYTGTNVPITIDINKITNANTSVFWQSVLNISPEMLKLDALTWPDTLYSLTITQTDDVMCRVVDDYKTYELSSFVTEETLSTTMVAEVLFDFYFPFNIIIDEEEQTIALLDSDGSIEQRYQITKSTSPSDQLLIKVAEIVEGTAQQYVYPDYFLFIDQQLMKVELNEKMQTSASNNVSVTFDNNTGFTQTLYQHLYDQVKPLIFGQ